MIDGRSKSKDNGQGWEEGCDCEGADEDFPLLPLKKLTKSCKSLAFTASIVTGTGEILSSSSSE